MYNQTRILMGAYKNIIVVTSLICFGCKVPSSEIIATKSTDSLAKSETLVLEDIHKCTTAEDTVFSNGDHIKYVLTDSKSYGVQLKLDSIIDTLSFRFNCNVSNGMIPSVLFKSSNLVLIQGSASSYRYVTVCVPDKKSMKIKATKFETEIVQIPEGLDLVFFQKTDTIYLCDRTNLKLFTKKLPAKVLGLQAAKCQFFSDEMIVVFEQDSLIYKYKDFGARSFNR